MADHRITTNDAQLVTRPEGDNPATVYLARLSPGSRRTMRQCLDALALRLGGASGQAFPWGELRYIHTQKLRADLAASGMAPATASKYLHALRGALKEAWRLGQMSAEDHARAADLAPLKGSALPAGRALSAGEIKALFRACPDSTAGARDAALLALAYGAGLRRAELVALDLADFNRETGALTVRHGKGNRARTVYATNGGRLALDAWITRRGSEAGALIVPVDKADRPTVARMTPQAVLYILRRCGERAGVAAFSPHDLRRTCISDLIDGGADLVAVRDLAGHASVVTTSRYDRRGEAAKRHAAELLHVPFVARVAR